MEETKRRRFIIRAVLDGEVDVQEEPSEPKSDMNGWTDGIAYTDLVIVDHEYVNDRTGEFVPYDSWSRTGYVPCDGCSSLTFNHAYQASAYAAFYDADHNRVAGLDVRLSSTPRDYVVPDDAHYFVISFSTQNLLSTIESGIIPNA